LARAFLRSTIRALVLLNLLSGFAYGSGDCAVLETRNFATITGSFLVSGTTVNVTIPSTLLDTDSLNVFLESPAEVPLTEDHGPLFLRSGQEATELRNGAFLRLHSVRGSRLEFSVTSLSGQSLCSWRPSLGFLRRSPSSFGYRASAVQNISFAIAGRPVLV